jgi:hypothetical protein
MAHLAYLTNAAANAAADAVCAQCNNGYLRIYAGPRPATADTALAGNTLLAELRFAATAFAAAVAGVATANAIAPDAAADASGAHTFGRAFRADGVTGVWDGETGVSGSDINLGASTIVQGGQVSITSMTYTQSKV